VNEQIECFISFYFASFCKRIEVIEENAIVIRFLFFLLKFQ